MYSPDDKLMCFISDKRARWYLNRDLATLVSDEYTQGLAIKLKFKPEGDGWDSNLLTPRENKCVVCGVEEHLTKHHIIPYRYRKHLTQDVKDYNSFDVVLLCDKHHMEYETKSQKYDQNWIVPQKKTQRKKVDKVQSYVNALRKYKSTIPKEKITQMESFLEEKGISVETFETPKVRQDSQDSVFQIAANKITDIDAFFISWRKHFVETMNPRYMPMDWEVNRCFRGADLQDQ
jgi:hypothetical protein